MPAGTGVDTTSEAAMADLVVVLGVLAFFGLSVLFVMGLDRLVGPDDDVAAASPSDDAGRDDATLTDSAVAEAGR
jgi:hypothetical protein